MWSYGDTQDGDEANRRYECRKDPADARFAGFLGQAGEEEGDEDLTAPDGEEEENVGCIDGLRRESLGALVRASHAILVALCDTAPLVVKS